MEQVNSYVDGSRGISDAPTRFAGRPVAKGVMTVSDVDEAREKVRQGRPRGAREGPDSSVRLLIIYRLLRIVALVASAVTPVLVLLDAEKIWTTLVAACAAVALGLIQLTSLGELSLVDRDRADRLRRAFRRFETDARPYVESSDNEKYRSLSRKWRKFDRTGQGAGKHSSGDPLYRS
jgi:Protein of unknown function (DUF4231)